MATAEERMKILDMVRDGKLSADEGARLLQALQGQDKRSTSTSQEPRWMRIKVTDLRTGVNKVSVNLPMGVVRVGIRMGARFVPEDVNINYDNVMTAIRNGSLGKVVDIEDRNENERVEIWLE
jgi:hypothetical protein